MPNFGSDSIQVSLNSRYATRYVGNSNSNVVFNLSNLYVPKQHHLHLSLANVVIPYSFYNVNESNNMLIYLVNGLQYTVYIEPGNYNVMQLLNYLNQHMIGFTITYDSVRNKYTFNCGTSFTFSFMSSCLRMLGITMYESINNKLTSNLCVNLQTIQTIYLRTNFTTGNFACNSLYNQNILASIPVNNSLPNSNIVYINQGSQFTVDLYTNTLNDFYIMLTDQDDNLINLNGVDWHMVLQIDIVDFTV